MRRSWPTSFVTSRMSGPTARRAEMRGCAPSRPSCGLWSTAVYSSGGAFVLLGLEPDRLDADDPVVRLAALRSLVWAAALVRADATVRHAAFENRGTLVAPVLTRGQLELEARRRDGPLDTMLVGFIFLAVVASTLGSFRRGATPSEGE